MVVRSSPPTVSVSVTVKFAVPSAAGVPKMMPVEASRERPSGRVPSVTAQENVPSWIDPLWAFSVMVYASPTRPAGSAEVVMRGSPRTSSSAATSIG